MTMVEEVKDLRRIVGEFADHLNGRDSKECVFKLFQQQIGKRSSIPNKDETGAIIKWCVDVVHEINDVSKGVLP